MYSKYRYFTKLFKKRSYIVIFFIILFMNTIVIFDDPNKVQEVENIIIDFYNGMARGSLVLKH